MLIDRKHVGWAVGFTLAAATALTLYFVLQRRQPSGWMAGGAAGVRYAAAGAALMIYAALLAGLRKVPRWWWLGRRQTWLRGHIWLGSLSALLIGCHSGFRWGGPWEQLLWAAFLLTLLTGFAGVALQHWLPRLITVGSPKEVPVNEMPFLCRELIKEADVLAGRGRETSGLTPAAKKEFTLFYEQEVRPFLAYRQSVRATLRDPVKAKELFDRMAALPGVGEDSTDLATLREKCDDRRAMAEQERLHFWLHAWLYLHVPISAALLALTAVHAWRASYY